MFNLYKEFSELSGNAVKAVQKSHAKCMVSSSKNQLSPSENQIFSCDAGLKTIELFGKNKNNSKEMIRPELSSTMDRQRNLPLNLKYSTWSMYRLAN